MPDDSGAATTPSDSASQQGPPPKSAWLPWSLTAVSAIVALVALVQLGTPPDRPDDQVIQLEAQVQRLQQQLDRVKGQRDASRERAEKSKPPPAPEPPVILIEAAPDKPPEPVAAAPLAPTDQDLALFAEDRAYARIEHADRVAKAVDTLLLIGAVDDMAALRIEVLLRSEFDDLWDLRERVLLQTESKANAKSQRKRRVAQTNTVLGEHLDENGLALLRDRVQ